MKSLLSRLFQLKQNIVFKNALYLGLIQVVNYVFPLLTIPFLVKIFGVKGFGVIALSQVVVSYICIISDYGFNMSATRYISVNKTNFELVNKIFSGVIYSKILIASVCVLFSIGMILFVPMFQENRSVYLISLVFVSGQVLFPIWLFQGMEKMGKIAVFNSIFKFFFTVSIFLFVRDKTQIVLVAWLYALGSSLAGISALIYAMKIYKLKFIAIKIEYIKQLLIDGFDIFLPSFFSSVLANGGILFLGIFHSPSLVGYYSAIDRLVKAGIGLLSTITQSLFPNISYKFSIDRKLAIRSIISSAKLIISALIGVSIIIIIFSKPILSIIYSPEYVKYSYVLGFLMVWACIAFINNFLGIQFLVGSGNSIYYRKAFIISGVFMFLSFITIKYWDIDGILFSTLMGEVILTISMIYLINKNKLYAN